MHPLLPWKTISITYSEGLFVALDIQRTVRMRHIVISGLPGCTVYFHIILQMAQLKKKTCYGT